MEQTLVEFLPIGVLLGIGIFFAILAAGAVAEPGSQAAERALAGPYEAGMTAVGEAQKRFPVKFYRIAVLFILFDVDIILLVPWAVTFRSLGYFGLAAMLIFMVLFIVGDLWVWKKGVLEWE
jgi:NADH-quinone oxidoreductase subunit A